jgi:hypothetical protein
MPVEVKKGTVNHTGRKRILRKNFRINVDWSGDEPKIDRDSFFLSLPGDLPSGSRVFIDVNHRMNYQFFDIGKKANIEMPEDLTLDEIGFNSMTFIVRVIDPSYPGLLSARSAPYRIKPPSDSRIPRKGETFSLLQFEPRDLETGVPMRVNFPSIQGSSEPVAIQINRNECEELYITLEEEEPAYHALVLPSHLTSIVERLASDALREIFDPQERVTTSSSWQSHWNHLFSSWTGKGLGEVDAQEPGEVSDWIDEILAHWSMISGNPAKRISRHLGGVRG